MDIVHFDMDMFFAAVEIRDDPSLAGKPLIIGAMPGSRGVVSTCSYEARKFGVRSAMPISEAYRRCPHGIYMHPNGHKYVAASRQIQGICSRYTDLMEYYSLDEGSLDVTGSTKLFGSAEHIGLEIKRRIREETGLPCSVGIGYSIMSAKLASEEKKPDGFYVIPTAEALRELIIDRSVRVIYGVGPQTEAQLAKINIRTVRDLFDKKDALLRQMGGHGRHLIDLACGKDDRVVAAASKSQSLSSEITFQHDITDHEYLKDVLRLIARDLSYQIRLQGTYIRTVTLKVTYMGFKKITRSKSGEATNRANDIYDAVSSMLGTVDRRPIRLVGISLSGFSDGSGRQISLFEARTDEKNGKIGSVTTELQRRFGKDIVKSGSELISEKRVGW